MGGHILKGCRDIGTTHWPHLAEARSRPRRLCIERAKRSLWEPSKITVQGFLNVHLRVLRGEEWWQLSACGREADPDIVSEHVLSDCTRRYEPATSPACKQNIPILEDKHITKFSSCCRAAEAALLQGDRYSRWRHARKEGAPNVSVMLGAWKDTQDPPEAVMLLYLDETNHKSNRGQRSRERGPQSGRVWSEGG